LLVVTFASLLLLPFSTLLPVFARDILAVGAKGQGLLLTSIGVGALLTSVLVGSVGDRMPTGIYTRGIVTIGGVGIYGVLLVIFAASSLFALSLAVMAIGVAMLRLMRLCRLSFEPIRCPNFTAGRWRYFI
jgi:hypothetical protein